MDEGESVSSISTLLSTVFVKVSESTPAIVLLVIALLLLATALVIALKAHSGPEEQSPLERWILFSSIIGAITLAVFSQWSALIVIPQPVSTDAAIERLRTNSEIQYFIRLIPYSGSRPSLPKLGTPQQKYTFVASYEELVGYHVAEAVHRMGISMRGQKRVIAVIFPYSGLVYPANAKGVLQVIQQIDDLCANGSCKDKENKTYKGFNVKNTFQPDSTEWSNFESDSPESWAWEGYKQFFTDYCTKALGFIRFSQQYDQPNSSYMTAQALMGTIRRDWSPLGFALKTPISRDDAAACQFGDWGSVMAPVRAAFGARVFLIENRKISDLDVQVMRDFDDPVHDVIPDIGVR
jgi:hypothetical protein